MILRTLAQYAEGEGSEIVDVAAGIAELDRGESVSLREIADELETVVADSERRRTAI